MFGFYEKRRLKHILFSKVTLLILGVAVAFFVTAVWDVYQKAQETAVKRAQREAELAELQEREAMLRSELDRLSTARGLEEEIRGRFEVVREGEGIIVIVDPSEEESQVAAAKEAGFWERLFGWF